MFLLLCGSLLLLSIFIFVGLDSQPFVSRYKLIITNVQISRMNTHTHTQTNRYFLLKYRDITQLCAIDWIIAGIEVETN